MKITGLGGQNYIAVGLTTTKQLMFDGTAGDFFGALNNGAIINLKGTARRFLGDTMSGGGIILQGNAQRGVGHAMTGGIIVIRGNVTGDIGQMAKGGTIIVSGNCGPRSGAYMFNGELIIGGNVGADIGLNMMGGTIYVGGKLGALGNNVQNRELTIAEEAKLRKYFDHYGITQDVGEFSKLVPISTNPMKDKFFQLNSKLEKPQPEQKNLEDKIIHEITTKTENDLLHFTRSFKNIGLYMDRLSIIPAQTKPIKNFKLLDSEIDMRLTIGAKLGSPLQLEVPFILSNRGAGVVSKSCQMAYVFAGAKLKTAVNSTGGTYPEGFELNSKHNGKLIQNWDLGRFGVNVEYLTKGNAIEIILGKGGSGSLQTIIPAAKINSELKDMWQIPEAADIILPPKMFDFDVPADLKRHVELLREITEKKLPIMIKLAAGNVYEDTKLAIRAGADAIILEGFDEYDSSQLDITANNLGLPTIATIPQGSKAFRDIRADNRDIKLLVSGMFRNGADIYKALALGADGVVINKTAEMAIGCKLCGDCNSNACPEGIATTHPEREIKLDWVEAGQKLQNFLSTVCAELKLLIILAGYRAVSEIDIKSLRALDYDTAAVTGAPLIGYKKLLPMWEH